MANVQLFDLENYDIETQACHCQLTSKVAVQNEFMIIYDILPLYTCAYMWYVFVQ